MPKKSKKPASPAQLAARARFAAAAKARAGKSKSAKKPMGDKVKMPVAFAKSVKFSVTKSGKGLKTAGLGKVRKAKKVRPTMTRKTISEPTARKSARLFW